MSTHALKAMQEGSSPGQKYLMCLQADNLAIHPMFRLSSHQSLPFRS